MKYASWTEERWRSVMFSGESAFWLICGTLKVVRRPRSVLQYNEKYTIKTVKHPDTLRVWGVFSGNKGRGDLCFLPKEQTMHGTQYLEVRKDHLLGFYEHHQCVVFMRDGAPAHKNKTVSKWLSDSNISVLDWPGNLLDFNPIQNCLKKLKDMVAVTQPGNLKEMKDAVTCTWVFMDSENFLEFANSVPKRIQEVLKEKGNMTEY